MIKIGSFVRFVPAPIEAWEEREYVGQVTWCPRTGDYLSVTVTDHMGSWTIAVRRDVAMETTESAAMLWMLENS